MSLGEKIITLRKEKGLNAYQCSIKLGVSPSRFTYIEKGRNLPSAELLIKLCNFFNVSADWLLGLKEDRN